MPDEHGEFDNLRDALDDYRQRRGPRDVVPRKLPTLADSAEWEALTGAPATITTRETTITDDGVTVETTTQHATLGRPLLGPVQDIPEGKTDDD
ncbi:hypothetical protein [Mycobacterium scrofulaceum]|uniref:Uncharacterized protein n=1 Tax=Mycobacterium scrofulaceum TaxID=1783 RepID=A0A1A2W0I4_MYCSC|nr:hypothetical protein [Mycobacterium scrofulaceum]OBI07069.1 hypothetical protein A5679_11545 [Mycobacterium scrofulaceum]